MVEQSSDRPVVDQPQGKSQLFKMEIQVQGGSVWRMGSSFDGEQQ